MFDIDFTPEAKEDLKSLRKFEHRGNRLQDRQSVVHPG
jgi:hypothetical protein